MGKKRRKYELRARGGQLARTRMRIVDATVALHEELGPRRTTISAIAGRAGVERRTVYRHFPDEREIYRACASCWLERNPVPDPAAWRSLDNPAERTRKALHLLYSYFARTQRMLRRVLHDAEDIPALAEAAQGLGGYARGVADDLAAAWAAPASRRIPLRAVLRHAVDFPTWASLDREGIGDAAKARLIVSWAAAVAAKPAQAGC
jgi:AcrR family transcriptional regulator